MGTDEKTQIREDVISTIKEVVDTEQEITLKTDLVAERILNSVDALEVLVNLEQKYKFEIDDEDLNAELLRTVDTITDYIIKKIS